MPPPAPPTTAGPAYDAAIEATGAAAADGTGEEAFEHACRTVGINPPGPLAHHQPDGRDLPQHPHRAREDGNPPRHPRLPPRGPFLALKRKGAHDPNCLKDPVPELVNRMLDTSGTDLAAGKLGCIRQITISTPPTGPPNTSGAPAARWSKLLPAKSTPVPPVFETTSYA